MLGPMQNDCNSRVSWRCNHYSMLLELIELLQMAIGCPSCPRMANNEAGLSVEKISRLVLDEHFLFIFD